MSAYVPVIDLDRDDTVVAAELDRVCREVGFFQIVGHGVEPEVEERAWRAFTRFFDLPVEAKLALRPGPAEPYGYIPAGAESLARSTETDTETDTGTDEPPGDVKESLNIGPMDPPAHPLSGPDEAAVHTPNRWPDALPELEPAARAYTAAMTALTARLMRLFALGLDLPATFFDDKIDRSPHALRAVNYPATSVPLAKGQLRAGAHTDYGLLTILRQDAVGGLEVLDHAGAWAAVPAVPGAYVLNIGDLMARWTNDRWRSTLHRVVNPVEGAAAAARRQSVPFFANANWDADVRCLPSCLAPGETPRYAPVEAGPHLLGKFRRTVAA